MTSAEENNVNIEQPLDTKEEEDSVDQYHVIPYSAFPCDAVLTMKFLQDQHPTPEYDTPPLAWTIHDYPKILDEAKRGVFASKRSDVFTQGGFQWRLVLYPNGLSSYGTEGKYVAVYLEITNLPPKSRIRVKSKITILHPSNNPAMNIVMEAQPDEFSTGYTTWGYIHILDVQKVGEYLHTNRDCGGELKIEISIGKFETGLIKQLRYHGGEHQQHQQAVVRFHVHRAVLSKISKVFAGMFEDGGGGGREIDVHPYTDAKLTTRHALHFEAFLRFIYSFYMLEAANVSSVEPCCELIMHENALDLGYLAHYYDVKQLTEYVQLHLKSDAFSSSTSFKGWMYLLCFAQKNHMENLRVHCLAQIKTRFSGAGRTVYAAKEKPYIDEYKKSNPGVLFDVLDHLLLGP